MSWLHHSWETLLLSGIVSAIPFAPLACPGTTHVSVQLKMPGVEGSVDVEVVNPPGTYTATGDENTNGTCVDATFLDENGDLLETQPGVKLPATGTVPDGTADFELESVECPEESSGSPGIGSKTRWVGKPKPWYFQSVPVGGSAARERLFYSMTIEALRPQEAEGLKDLIIKNGLGAPKPTGSIGAIRVSQWATMQVEGTEVHFRLIDDERIVSLDFVLNLGAHVYDLDDAATFEVNGWHVADLYVPLVNFNTGAGSRNDFEVDFSVEGITETYGFSGFVEL